jgi:hypothetical chaperone protein
MKTLCGIDFGTSNSTIAIVRGSEIALVPVEGTSTTIPSAIFYPSEGDSPLYGREAIATYTAREHGRLMRSLKSILGSDLITERTPVGGRSQTFEAILVGFLKHLKAKAETFAGGRIDEVVMGRPVHFVDGNEAVDARAQAKLGDIACAAGFANVAFQFEPIAAALSFEHTVAKKERAFIADIGGGTADFSIVEVGPDRRNATDRSGDILANDGIRVGGTNLDMRLSMAAVMPELGSRSKTVRGHDLPRWPFVDLATWHMIHTIGTPKNRLLLKQILGDCAPPVLFARYMEVVKRQTGHLIAGKVEEAKIALTASPTATLDLGEAGPIPPIEATAPQFEAAIEHELERLDLTVAATLAASGMKAKDITALFLTGGTSAVPAVRRLLMERLPAARVVEGDLFNSVGFGLALEAKRRRFG